MINSTEKLELNKILSAVSEYAVTEGGKSVVKGLIPSVDLSEAEYRLSVTQECDKLLYVYGLGKIEAFSDITDELSRAKKGSTLS